VAVAEHAMWISSGHLFKALLKKFRLRGACYALLLAVCTAELSAQVSPSASDLPSDQQVLAFLTESIKWYRHRAVERQIATDPVDLVFLEDNRQLAGEIVQVSFDFARADAPFATTSSTDIRKGSTAAANGSSPDLAQFVQMEKKVELEGQQASQEIESIKKKLLTARGEDRRKLQAALDATHSRLDVLQAGSATLRQLIEFGRMFGGRETGDLPSSIDNLARTVPDVIGPTAVEAQRQTSDLAAVSKPRDSGIFGLSSEVSALGRKLSILDEDISLTDKLRRSSDNLRIPMIASINKQRISSGTDIDLQASDLTALRQQKARLDEFAALVKALSPAIVALDKQRVLLTAYTSHLKSWRAAIASEDKKTWKNLMLRLAGVAVVIGALLLIGAVARSAIRRHVQDVDRRHVLLVIQRVVVWFTIVVVTAFSFATDLNSLATFFGLLTAGVAVALQSVIVSALGYFMLVGRHGIKLGDRVQILGMSGDVTDIGWLQFQVREIDKKTQQPTGQVFTFPNSFVLSSGGLGKFNREDVEPAQLEVAGKTQNV
jgi:hypothetical protein